MIREYRVEIVEGRVVCYSISGSKGSLFHYGLTGLFCCIVVKRLQMGKWSRWERMVATNGKSSRWRDGLFQWIFWSYNWPDSLTNWMWFWGKLWKGWLQAFWLEQLQQEHSSFLCVFQRKVLGKQIGGCACVCGLGHDKLRVPTRYPGRDIGSIRWIFRSGVQVTGVGYILLLEFIPHPHPRGFCRRWGRHWLSFRLLYLPSVLPSTVTFATFSILQPEIFLKCNCFWCLWHT